MLRFLVLTGPQQLNQKFFKNKCKKACENYKEFVSLLSGNEAEAKTITL